MEWTEYFEGLHNTQSEYPPLKVRGDVIVVLSLADRESFASWAKNVDQEGRNPLGTGPALPFAEGMLDLVINRHSSYWPSGVRRVLRPGVGS